MRSMLTIRRTAALATCALVLSACGGDTTTADPAPAPVPAPPTAPQPEPEPEPEPAPDTQAVVAVHLVRSTPTTFFVEPVPVMVPSVGGSVSARITAAIEALLTLRASADPDLFTSVPEGVTLRSVTVDGSVATLDLSGTSGASAQETTFAQQLAHTARVDASIDAVRLIVDGEPVDELWGHLDWSEPIAADPFILSPVTITVPLAGDEVPSGPLTVRGQATVFEATVLVSLLDADGTVVQDGFVTASTGAPERGTWEWEVTLPGPGEYTIVAGESDPSEGEGRPAFTTRRTVRAG
jgi:hypothetical protein